MIGVNPCWSFWPPEYDRYDHCPALDAEYSHCQLKCEDYVGLDDETPDDWECRHAEALRTVLLHPALSLEINDGKCRACGDRGVIEHQRWTPPNGWSSWQEPCPLCNRTLFNMANQCRTPMA